MANESSHGAGVTVLTVGHSNRALPAFIELLHEHQVELRAIEMIPGGALHGRVLHEADVGS